MTDIYTQENGSKKKFLAPVLVILLCMVSLTAAGYAYSATVTNTDDDIIVDGLTMQLTDADDNEVKAPMYQISDIHIGTHTTNGYALNYGAYGFTTEASQEDGQAHAGKIVDTKGESALNTFKEGYYVEVYKGTSATAVGYHAATEAADITTASIASLIDAVSPGKAITKIGDDFKLNFNNLTGKTVNASVTAKWDSTPATFEGINAVFIVVKDSSNNVVAVETVDTTGEATVFSAAIPAEDSTYTVQAYAALTDYYSETLPTDTDGKFFNEKFTVSFSAKTVA